MQFVLHNGRRTVVLVVIAVVSKGKERKRRSIYVAPFIVCILSKRSDMDHTGKWANYTTPAFPS